MTRMVRLGLILLACAATGRGQDAEVRLLPLRHEAGRVDQGASFTGVFRVHNDTEGKIRILSVDFGCPCARGSAERDVVEAGAVGEIPFRFETRGLEGRIAKVLVVKTLDADGRRREHRARIEVEVRAGWSLEPSRWNFGAVDPGAMLTHRFEIRYRDPDRDAAPPFALEVRDERVRPIRDARGRLVAFEFRRRAPELAGGFRDSFTVRSNDPACPDRVVDLEGEVRGDLIVSPREILFGTLPRGRGARRVLTITSRSGRSVRIRAVRGMDALELRPWSREPAPRHNLDLRLPADLPAGTGRGTLIVEIEGEGRALRVPFRYGVRDS